jgi:dTDP-4-amino-4,6-dideoxygalactose transaminase
MLRFNVPYVSGRELAYLRAVFERRDFAGNGPFTQRCSRLMEERFGVRKVLLTHSCTAALEMSALLAGLKPGDEAIVPSFTFATTASAIMRTGARVVFCEIDPGSLMMDAKDVTARITERTRVIVPVHYAGIAADMDGLKQVVDDRDIAIIEDAAQALDSAIDGSFLGTIGRFGCISFHESKNIHAGLAGALFVNREEDIAQATFVWERGTNRQQFLDGLVDKYTWVALGSSFYPTELQAAMLLAQLECLDENRAQRGKIYAVYQELFDPLVRAKRIQVPMSDNRRRLNYHAFFLVFDSHGERERVRAALGAKGIEAQFHYVPLHSSPMGRKMGYVVEDLPVTEAIAGRVLRLPLHCDMTVSDAEYVANAVNEAIEFRGS